MRLTDRNVAIQLFVAGAIGIASAMILGLILALITVAFNDAVHHAAAPLIGLVAWFGILGLGGYLTGKILRSIVNQSFRIPKALAATPAIYLAVVPLVFEWKELTRRPLGVTASLLYVMIIYSFVLTLVGFWKGKKTKKAGSSDGG